MVGLLLVALLGGLVVDLSGDGLRTYEDVIHKTDPLKADTDGDGLTDYEEIHEYETDPLRISTSGDGLSDYEEVHEHGTNPRFPRTDGDGLPDAYEVNKYGTDPANPDTDEDGLDDREEIQSHDTDPLDPDTDGDNLTDYEEVEEYETDPDEPDMDGDTLTDYEEVEKVGTSPFSEDSRGTGMPDAVAADVLLDPMSDPLINETEKLEPYFEADVNIYKDRPISARDILNDGVDSSGDGFSDAFSDAEVNLTTDEIDIFVQVSYHEDTAVHISSLRWMQKAYAEAPVNNTAGEQAGINLHFYIDSEPVPTHTTRLGFNDYERYHAPIFTGQQDFTAHGYGFYHAFITEKVYTPDNPAKHPAGLAHPDYDAVLVTDEGDSEGVGETLMHELGHRLGLWSDQYEGIDSHRMSSDEYPSAMNYNVHELTYSDGPGFDDWEYIEAHLGNNTPSTKYLG